MSKRNIVSQTLSVSAASPAKYDFILKGQIASSVLYASIQQAQSDAEVADLFLKNLEAGSYAIVDGVRWSRLRGESASVAVLEKAVGSVIQTWLYAGADLVLIRERTL